MVRSTKMTPAQEKAFEYIKAVKKYYDENLVNIEARIAQEKLQIRGQLIKAVDDGVAAGLTVNYIALNALNYKNLTGFQTFKHKYNSDVLTSGTANINASLPPVSSVPASNAAPTSAVVQATKPVAQTINLPAPPVSGPKLVKWEDYNDWDTFYAAFEVSDYLFKSDDEKYDFQVISKRDARPGLGPSRATVDFHFPLIEDNQTNTFFFTLRENATTGVQLSASNMDDRMEDITRQLLSEAFPDAHFTLAFDNRRPRVASTASAPAINKNDERVEYGGYMALKTHGESTSMVEKYGITREGIENTPVESWHRKITTPLGSVERKED